MDINEKHEYLYKKKKFSKKIKMKISNNSATTIHHKKHLIIHIYLTNNNTTQKKTSYNTRVLKQSHLPINAADKHSQHTRHQRVRQQQTPGAHGVEESSVG